MPITKELFLPKGTAEQYSSSEVVMVFGTKDKQEIISWCICLKKDTLTKNKHCK